MEISQQSERLFFSTGAPIYAEARYETKPREDPFPRGGMGLQWECSKASLPVDGHFNADALSKAVV